MAGCRANVGPSGTPWCLWSHGWMSVGQQEEVWPVIPISLICQSNFPLMLQCLTVAYHHAVWGCQG
jgi:hypothetical protein